MKGNVRIHQRVRYPAAGVKSDIETLLQKFVDTKSVRYEEFVRLWREGNYSLIHAGRSGLRENREFVEETFKIALVFALPPYSLQVRVAGVYTLYGLYHSQRSKPKQKVRIPLSCWKDLLDLHEEVKKHRHLDADYIIRKMIHDDVFEHVAYPAPLSVYSFYNEDDDDGFVEDTDNSAWQKDSNLLTNLLDEDSLGQLAAVHNKYHQLKCHLNSLRGGDPNKPSTSLDLIQNDLVDTIITHAQEPEIVVTSPTRNRKKTGRKLSAGSSEVSASERAQRVSEIKQRALKSKVNTSSRSLRYLNQGVEEEKDETTVRTPQRNKRGRPFKTILKAKVPRRSSRDSDESSEDDVITGIITPADPGTAKKRASRKAKKQAHNKMTKLVLGNHGSDDDDIDLREEDSDDEYDVAEECARELNTNRRTFRSALKRVKQAQISLADSEEGGAPSASEESRKSLSKSVSAAPDSAKRRKLRSSDPSPLNISPDATKQSTDHVAEISSYQEHALPTIGRKTRARTACSTAGSPIEAVPKPRSLEERGTTISSSTKKRRKSKAKIEDDTPVKSSSVHTATILKTDEVAPPVDDTACILESPDEDVDTRPITPSAKRFNPKHQNIHLPSTDESLAIELKPNELVAFRPLPKYRERPLVGKVVSFTETEVDVTWWMGTYTKKWYVWSTGKGNARKVEREKISREDVILAGFQFTASNKLPVQVAKTLRRMYARLQPKPINL
ncbi:uncharacterized protein LOC143463139 isoform X3 [Clavelina lepadiformis]|uniref:uncharacterized protein LOC143463139 isoform X3 n=1 Tax=Clavelina lepadiformis TaxID=159417 RepID=UPI0040414C8A